MKNLFLCIGISKFIHKLAILPTAFCQLPTVIFKQLTKLCSFKIVAVVSVVIFVWAISSCKYDDGPKISLATKKSRVANVWKIEKSFTNGSENLCDQVCKNERDKFIIVLTKDGNVMVKGELLDQSYESFGEWQFSSDKTEIGIKMKCRAEFDYYKILRLKSEELWTEYTDPVTKVKYETHRIPA